MFPKKFSRKKNFRTKFSRKKNSRKKCSRKKFPRKKFPEKKFPQKKLCERNFWKKFSDGGARSASPLAAEDCSPPQELEKRRPEAAIFLVFLKGIATVFDGQYLQIHLTIKVPWSPIAIAIFGSLQATMRHMVWGITGRGQGEEPGHAELSGALNFSL